MAKKHERREALLFNLVNRTAGEQREMQAIQETTRFSAGGASLKTLLDATSGNQRRAARTLGLWPPPLHEKMKRLGLLKRRNGLSELEDEEKLA